MKDRLPEVNLLPQYERQRSSSIVVFFLLITLIVVSYLFIGVNYFVEKTNLQKLETYEQSLNEDIEALESKLTGQSSEGITTLKDAISFVEGHRIPTSTFNIELNSLLPKHSYLSKYEYTDQEVKIITEFETLDAIAEYTNKLMTSNFVSDSKVNKIETTKLLENLEKDEKTRYEANFTVTIDKRELKGASEEDA